MKRRMYYPYAVFLYAKKAGYYSGFSVTLVADV